MQEFSRVKKNQKLYKEILKEDKTKIIEKSLRDYEQRVNRQDNTESTYQASRYRKNLDQSEEDLLLDDSETETPPKDLDYLDDDNLATVEQLSQDEILRNRDLLEDFINEVKNYNINRGLRKVEDTQINILKSLNKKDNNEKKVPKELVENQTIEVPAEIVEKKEPEKLTDNQQLTQEIQTILSDLDNEETYTVDESSDDFVFKPLDKEKEKKLSNIFEEIEENSEVNKESKKVVFKPSKEDQKPNPKKQKLEFIEADEVLSANDDKVQRDYKANELLELTQTLNLKLDLQEEADIEEYEQETSFIDKVLTVFLALLVLILLVIVIYGIYWVYTERGGF